MRVVHTAVFVAAAFLVGPVLAADLTPQQQADVLREALLSYDRGIDLLRGNPGEARVHFRAAAEKMQLVADSGIRNGVLQYNLGNAYLQSGDVGRAIRSYRQAARLIPGDPRLESNLNYARTLCQTPIESSGERALASALLSWHERTSTHTRFALYLGAWMVCWCAMLLRLVRGTGVWVVVAAASAAMWLAVGTSVAVDFTGFGRQDAGVIIADQVTVRKGNGTGFEPQFAQTLSPGVEFEVIERRGEWLNIQLPNGSTGWIQTSQAGLIE